MKSNTACPTETFQEQCRSPRQSWRYLDLYLAIMALALIAVMLPRIPQDQEYHRFADTRAWAGIPNFMNVISNALFLVVAAAGMAALRRTRSRGRRAADLSYLVFFIGVAATAFGSAYYHWNPRDASLVWDRMPMSVAFCALLSAIVADRVNERIGSGLLLPLVSLGVFTVVYWYVGQKAGHGDLRPYALVQFGSLLILLLLVTLFPRRGTSTTWLLIAFGLYGLGKIFELQDGAVFRVLTFVSGHTLKHILSALAAGAIALSQRTTGWNAPKTTTLRRLD